MEPPRLCSLIKTDVLLRKVCYDVWSFGSDELKVTEDNVHRILYLVSCTFGKVVAQGYPVNFCF